VERTNFYVPRCRLQCYSTSTVTSYLDFINYERVVRIRNRLFASLELSKISVKFNLKFNMKCLLFLATVVKLSAESNEALGWANNVVMFIISYFLC
jgi:hypothetical protein